jgi:hypothetical protein
MDLRSFKDKTLIVGVALFAAGVVTGWSAAYQVLVRPRDFEVERLERVLSTCDTYRDDGGAGVILRGVGIQEGTAATSVDGSCSIFVKSSDGDEQAVILVTIGDGPTSEVKMSPGGRERFESPTHVYLIDLNRLRGNLADLTVYRTAKSIS